MTLRVTRYDAQGRVFHTCLTPAAELGVAENGRLYVDMPMRFWMMVAGGRIEMHAE